MSVAGKVQSTSGGFKFPDGTVQTTAANTIFTITRNTTITLPDNETTTTILQVTPPVGTYMSIATVEFTNSAIFFGQNNSRHIVCRMVSGSSEEYSFDIAGPSSQTVAFHTVKPLLVSDITLF